MYELDIPATPIPFPPGATLLYGIGAQKAGTTWLSDLLRTSPECHFSPIKELHYFDVMRLPGTQQMHADRIATLRRLAGELTPDQGSVHRVKLRRIADLAMQLHMFTDEAPGYNGYLAYLLQGYGGQKVICDITPGYSVLNTIIYKEMQRVAPAKFIFLMRDPVDRMWSQVRMGVAARPNAPEDPAGFEAACLAWVRARHGEGKLEKVHRADYARTLEKLENALVPETREAQLLTLFYEDLFSQHSVDRICGFLGIAPLVADPGNVANPGRPSRLPEEAEARLYDGLRAQYDFAAARFGRDGLPAAWRDRMDRLAALPPPRR
jgi:hypothetical protein